MKNTTKFELCEINQMPFLFLSNYQKELEVDYRNNTIKSYIAEETKHKVREDEKGYYFISNDGGREEVSKDEIIDFRGTLYTSEEEHILVNESRFTKANKYLIIFLKFMPLLIVFLLSFRFPIDFTNLLNINQEGIGLNNIFDLAKIASLFVAVVMVYFGYKFKGSKALAIALVLFTYFLLFFLSVKFSFANNFTRDLMTSLFFIWSIKEMYFVYLRGYFDEYFYLNDIKRDKVIYREATFSKNKSILTKFAIGGHFFRIVR